MPKNAQKSNSTDIYPGLGDAAVWQDKSDLLRDRIASGEPYRSSAEARLEPGYQATTPSASSRVPITAQVKRSVKEAIIRMTKQGREKRQALSVSEVTAALLEKAVQGHIDMQYGALLKPVIERAIDKRLRARDARFAALLVRIAFDSGQARSLLTNLLARSPGVTPELLNAILDQSGKRAKANLTHLSPQITELIKIVETWMSENEAEGRLTPA